MSEETIGIDLNPKKVLAAMQEISTQVKDLAAKMDEALGKSVPQSMNKAEDAAEKGTNKIRGYFQNLSKTIKEDLKSGLDLTKFTAGIKLGKAIDSGVDQVFEMERAFAKLNSRLMLTNKQLADFKSLAVSKIAGNGQNPTDILPGIEVASSFGGIKNTGQLSQVGDVLSKIRTATGEDSKSLSETIVQNLKNQGIKITGDSFKEMANTLMGARINGNFQTANDAGLAVEQISGDLDPKVLKRLGLNSKNLAGLATIGSTGGAGTNEALAAILAKAQNINEQAPLNSAMGVELFKNGKFDPSALSKINPARFGANGDNTLAQITGLDQAGLVRLAKSMRDGFGSLAKVVNSSDEVSKQFERASDNLSFKVDKFKEEAKAAVSDVGEAFAELANSLLDGDAKKIKESAKGVGQSVSKNSGKLIEVAGVGIGALALAGGGIRSLLSGAGLGLPAGMAEGAAVHSLNKDIQQVFVVNASEIGGGIGDKSGLAEALAFGGEVAAAIAAAIPVVLAGTAVAGSVGLMSMESDVISGKDGSKPLKMSASQEANNKAIQDVLDKIANFFTGGHMSKAIADGFSKTGQKPQYVQPSSVERRK